MDKAATVAIRARAQGFIVLITQGFGMLIGALISGKLYNVLVNTQESNIHIQWQKYWAIPFVAAAIIMLIFAVFFKDEVKQSEN